VIAVLRKSGIPFHNPYRKSNGYWNPLRRGSKGCANRFSSLVGHQPWKHGDVKLWAECLNPHGILRTGARELIDASDDSLPVTPDRIRELFETAPAEALLGAGGYSQNLLDWFVPRIAPVFHARLLFPVAVARHGGPSALAEPPRVTVGTIHSVKGGEADAVFLFPDLSRAGDLAYQRHGPERDSVIRLFYVGMTRARRSLYICQRETSMSVTL